MPCPSPIPDHLNSLDTIPELQIARGELLAATPHADSATGESQVAEISTGAIFHEDSDVRGAISLAHHKLDILNTGGLAHLPMDTRRRCRG